MNLPRWYDSRFKSECPGICLEIKAVLRLNLFYSVLVIELSLRAGRQASKIVEQRKLELGLMESSLLSAFVHIPVLCCCFARWRDKFPEGNTRLRTPTANSLRRSRVPPVPLNNPLHDSRILARE